MRLVSLEPTKSPVPGTVVHWPSSPPPSLELKSYVPPAGLDGATAIPAGISTTVQVRCRIVRQLTAEMVMLVSERVQLRRDRRRASCHIRQIAMYICHVVLQLSLTDIGVAFGRDRTTVGHACNVVEDRRDDKAYDEFVSAIERVVTAVFGAVGSGEHE